MICVDDHHDYKLENFEDKNSHQTIKFIKKEPVDATSGELQTVHDGTTNEELLKVLIHRLTEMGKKFPCRENSLAITKLDEALMWLEKRTADRKARGVEGKALK